MDIDIKNKNIYFLGIGGHGIGAMAEMLADMRICGDLIGSDKCSVSEMVCRPSDKIRIVDCQDIKALDNADILIYTEAVMPDNVVIKRANELQIPIFSRSEFLIHGLCPVFSEIIAISGCHGKSTSTSIAYDVYVNNGIKASVLLGAQSIEHDAHAVFNGYDVLIVEVDDSSPYIMNNIKANIGVIVSFDIDHIAKHGSIDEYVDAHIQYLHNSKQRISDYKFLEYCLQRRGVNLQDEMNDLITFGIDKNSCNDIDDCKIYPNINGYSFSFTLASQTFAFNTSMIGKHFMHNAMGIFLACMYYGINTNDIKEAIESCRGVKWRFQVMEKERHIVILDYAHHPTAIKYTIQTCREINPNGRVILIFEPSAEDRVEMFKQEFYNVLKLADVVFVTQEHHGCENATSDKIQEIFNGVNIYSADSLLENAQPGDTLLFTGPTIYRICYDFMREYREYFSTC